MAAFVPPAGLIEGTGAYATWSAYRRQVYLNELYGEWLHTPVDGAYPDTTGLVAPVVLVSPGASEVEPNREAFYGTITPQTQDQAAAVYQQWVGSIGWAQGILQGSKDPAVKAAAAAVLAQAKREQELGAARKAVADAWQILVSGSRASKTSQEYADNKLAWQAAKDRLAALEGKELPEWQDMSDWAAGYRAQQAKYAAAGGEAAYWASQARGATPAPLEEPGYAPPAPRVTAPLASAPSRAAIETINQVAEEMLAKEEEEPAAATLALASLPGYKPIKLRPRT